LCYEDICPNTGYLKKKVQYKDKPTTIVDLSKGNLLENKLEHNYIFELDSTNLVKIYKLNCNLPLVSEYNILGEDTFGINDNFFNTRKFADINYYWDPRINEQENYVIINKVTPNKSQVIAGSDELFFNKNIPFKCYSKSQTVDPDEELKKEISDMGFNSEQIIQYIQFRKKKMTKEDSLDMILQS